MGIYLEIDALDRGLDDLAARQPAKTSRARLARSILETAVRAAEGSSDPLAWMPASLHPFYGRGNGSPAALNPDDQPTTTDPAFKRDSVSDSESGRDSHQPDPSAPAA